MNPLIAWLLAASAQNPPAPPQEPPEVIVVGRAENLVGDAESAGEGRVGQDELRRRPLLRTGEVLETVPGLIVTQHSGSGKANQFFLRGFNLDHGTDFATWVDGMPVNMPTHGHGQGYTDLNFLIPELVERIDYRKGPYFAEEGDFSSAGSARVRTFRSLPRGLARLELGEFGFQRAVAAHSAAAGPGRLLWGLEAQHYDGPWEIDENFVKYNGLVRFASGDEKNGADVTLMGYQGEWNSADQIPKRAVDAGTLDRFGVVDPTDGGRSRRWSLSGEWRSGTDAAATRANVYLIDYRLRLFSNFTYFMDDPANGDQFEQVDQRLIAGAAVSHRWFDRWFGKDVAAAVGLETRNDAIGEVGLHKTAQRVRLSTVRDDEVLQNSVGIWAEAEIRWTEWLRSTAGARGDLYRWDVESSVDANSGTETDAIAGPKLGLAFGPWADTEFYANAGLGFHSNDGRGATIRVDPTDGVTPVEPVDPLVRSKGAEAGVRTAFLPGLQSTVSVFLLDLDSELLFVGDAGITEPSRPSRRVGFEWANFYRPLPWLTLDLDYARTKARFKDSDPAGDHIPGAVKDVLAAGVSVEGLGGFLAALRVRYFGPRDLVEDGGVRSDATTLVSARLGYERDNVTVALEIFNLFNAEDDDIAYFYESQLPGEPAPVSDVHFHPVEPRAFRLGVTVRF
ncbi:MAG TPA: TonB-dependent receptor [Planctomycetota bacterium]|nr:TonB-dependent receptor [Planctomycetota bacterium]